MLVLCGERAFASRSEREKRFNVAAMQVKRSNRCDSDSNVLNNYSHEGRVGTGLVGGSTNFSSRNANNITWFASKQSSLPRCRPVPTTSCAFLMRLSVFHCGTDKA